MIEDGANVDLPIGTIVAGTYEIERKLASGGMGAVFVARHVRLGQRRVAIKVLFDRFPPGSELRARFRREAEICASLTHPNIVSVTDWNELPNGSPFLVMELLEGEDLEGRISRGPISMVEARHILEGIVEGVAAAHARKVVHRDLKPSNVFLVKGSTDDRPLVKILDFGISKIVDAKTLVTTSNRLLGTPRYMSPEQARGRQDVDERCDQFALASIAYELVAGIPAFGGNTLEAVLFNITHEAPEPLSQLVPETPKELAAAIYRGLAKKPQDRFPSVREFWTAITTVPTGFSEEDCLAAYRLTGGAPLSQTVQLPDAPAPSIKDLPQQAHGSTPKSRRWQTPVLGGAAILGLALGSAALARMWREESVTRPVAAPPPIANPSDSGTVKGVSSKVEDQAPAAVLENKAEPQQPGPVSSQEARKPVVERADVTAKLNIVQELYDKGQYQEALRLGRQSLHGQDTPRARLLIARAYCQLGDLGGAKTAVSKVVPGDRAIVLRTCKEKGLEL